MSAPSALFKASVLGAAGRQLQEFTQVNEGVRLAVLTSGDGFEIAAFPPAAGSTGRIAAMSSSIQALSQALAQEAGLTGNRSLIIETDTGTLLLLGLDQSTPGIALTIVASSKELLGKLLWASRTLCKTLEKTLKQ